MNRIYTQFRYSLEKRVIELFGKVTIGAAGAPTLDAAASKGIASIVRNSVGNYTITLSDPYVKLLGFNSQVLLAAGSPGAAYGPVIRSEDVDGAKTIVVQYLGATSAADTTAAATELASGSVVYFSAVLSGTSV